ncbi:MAG: hypothetical protein IPJ34_13865 [Myxococcales bacterium]|nr:hypothetical protein [Myxococcales bacterium]
MTLNGCEFDKACEGDPDVVRDAAVGYFVQIGYALEKRTDAKVHLKFDGTWFTTAPEKHTHHVYVAARAGGLHFEFTTGIVASYWTESDVKFAEGRADAAVRAARGFLANGGDYRGSDAEPMVACRYCGKISLQSLGHCTCCGAKTT